MECLQVIHIISIIIIKTKYIYTYWYTVISVDISIIRAPIQSEEEFVFELLDLIDIVLYSQTFTFIGLCIVVLFIAKINGVYLNHDNIRYSYFIYFIVFSLNFFANSITFVLRIFEQNHIILGIVSVCILLLCRLIFDVSITINSKETFIAPAFISKVEYICHKLSKAKILKWKSILFI